LKRTNEEPLPREDSHERMKDELRQLNLKIDSIIELNKQMLSLQREFLRILDKNREPSHSSGIGAVPDAVALLSLPTSLRKTMFALYKFEEATAEDLSHETKRLRAVESASANQLARMGYLEKKRVGRKVYFCIKNSFKEY